MPSAPRKRRGPGRPRKPKRARAVTLTLTLPNADFRRHLQRTAKAAGHKTPSALIIATFPLLSRACETGEAKPET
jgi:hypothetical protein